MYLRQEAVDKFCEPKVYLKYTNYLFNKNLNEEQRNALRADVFYSAFRLFLRRNKWKAYLHTLPIHRYTHAISYFEQAINTVHNAWLHFEVNSPPCPEGITPEYLTWFKKQLLPATAVGAPYSEKYKQSIG